MAQHDYNIANGSGSTVRSDINNLAGSIVSLNSGSSAPSTTFAYMLWADTTTGLLKMRNAANSAWVTVGTMASTGLGLAAAGANTDITSLTGLTTPLAYPQDFRLTLTSGTPVTTGDVTGATTIYAAPHTGNCIALYDGTKWITRTSAEFSLALGTLTANRPYDVFCYDNSGTPTLEFTSWTNDTTRATALAYQNGVLVRSGATTRRYLGTFYTDSTTATVDSYAKRYLYNFYHRQPRLLRAQIPTASWSYSSTTVRAQNSNTTFGEARVGLIIGVAQQIEADISCLIDNGASAYGTLGIGIDSTSASSSQFLTFGGLSSRFPAVATYHGAPAAGFHYLQALENCNTAASVTFNGSGVYQILRSKVDA